MLARASPDALAGHPRPRHALIEFTAPASRQRVVPPRKRAEVNLFIPMLILGLTTSVHCVAMCGSLVATYAVKDETQGSFLRRMLPHLAYQGAKILSYMAVGLALGAIGSAFNLTGIRGWVTVFAGLFMVLLGLQMTGWIPALRRFTLKPPKFLLDALMSTRRKAKSEAEEGKSNLATPVTFGALTGLMPCAPLQAAQLTAAASGSAVAGSLGMLAFGLGTMPLMLGFGAISGFLSAKMRTRMMGVLALVVVGFGLVMLNRGATLVGSPITYNTVASALTPSAPTQTAAYKTGADGVVEVPLTIANSQFVPASLSIPSDKPVRLIVDRREDNACSAQIAIPQMGVLANLKANGVTAVDIPLSKTGAYNLTCGMGMMSGTLRVGPDAPSVAGGVSPALLWAAVVAAAGLGFVAWRRRRTSDDGEPDGGPQRRGSRRGSGSSPSSRSSGRDPGRRRGPSEAAVPAWLAFSSSEYVLIAVAIGVTIVAGLVFGGAFRP